jgi:hypothetical protein
MTAISHAFSAPAPGGLERVRRSIARDQFFAGLCVLACANGLLGRIILAASTDGIGGLLTADVSVIVLFACFAGISKLLERPSDKITSADLAVGFMVLVCVVLPIYSLSWLALTGLCLYMLVWASGPEDRQRGALIMLALTVSMLWSRLLFQLFMDHILAVDSALAASLLGTARNGNLVGFADGSGDMIVLPACSSLTNMSLAFLCWVSVTQWFGHRWSPIDIFWSLLACVSVIAINVARIAVTGLSHSNYEMIHGGIGAQVFGVIILVVTVGISVLSARREIFSRP